MITFPSTFPHIDTERLLLRAMDLNDAEIISSLRSHPQVNKYIDRKPATDLQGAQEFIRSITQRIADKKCFYWGIEFKASKNLIGTCCLWNFDHTKGKAELGYEMDPDFHGKGLMREALTKLIKYCYDELKIKVLEAVTHKENQPSIKLLESFGFAQRSALPENPSQCIFST